MNLIGCPKAATPPPPHVVAFVAGEAERLRARPGRPDPGVIDLTNPGEFRVFARFLVERYADKAVLGLAPGYEGGRLLADSAGTVMAFESFPPVVTGRIASRFRFLASFGGVNLSLLTEKAALDHPGRHRILLYRSGAPIDPRDDTAGLLESLGLGDLRPAS